MPSIAKKRQQKQKEYLINRMAEVSIDELRQCGGIGSIADVPGL
jgi:hypothetical protein